MSAAEKRKAPQTVAAVKSARGCRGGQTNNVYYIRKSRGRQMFRFFLDYVRPVLAFLTFFFILGVVGGTENDTIELWAGIKTIAGMMLLWAVLLIPDMVCFNFNNRR